MISSEKNKVFADGRQIFQSRYNITKMLELDGLCVLLEESPLGIIYNRNVLAISPAGELLWKGEVIPAVSGTIDNPYMSLWEKEGEVWAGSWIGWAVQFDRADGHILQKVRL